MSKARHARRFGKPRRVTTAEPLSVEQLRLLIGDRDEGVAIEVEYPNVGAGYLFHVKKEGKSYRLFPYAGDEVTAFTGIEELTHFINHAAGLQFDAKSWRRSDELNRRREKIEEEPSQT